MKPDMRVDELVLLHRARHEEHLRLVEHGEGVMRDGRRRQEREAGKADSYSGHDPLHDIGTPNLSRMRAARSRMFVFEPSDALSPAFARETVTPPSSRRARCTASPGRR